MNSFGKDRDKWKRNNPIDFYDFDEDSKRIFRDMWKSIERKLHDPYYSDIKPREDFIYGYNFQIDPKGRPKMQEFVNKPELSNKDGEEYTKNEREPIIEIIEDNENVNITIEIPGVEKENIDLNITSDDFEIKVNTPIIKYHKRMSLPCDVIPKTSKVTYNNGVLDIVIKRKKRKNKNGYRINID